MATWTQEDIDGLKAKIASGVQSVSYTGPSGRTMIYQGTKALRDLLAEMIAQVTAEAGTRQSFRFACNSKGFGHAE